ncbi:MAG TPA: NAD(P)H-dependent oxidoreductase [Reyranellaceae bacterium]|nr:NAD(P)H-dependent oxidoreductase [Reyranellaceae bacterium]
MKALVVVGHPAPGSLNRALAEAIRDAWASRGCDVAFHDLVEEGFDPLLSAAEARGQTPSDPLINRHIAELRACELLAVVHPNHWGAPPAVVKGWIDRVFALNAAYGFEKGVDQGDVPVGLLIAKAALVINTGNTPTDREQAAFGDPLDRMWRDCVLRYCGIEHVMRRLFGVVATSSASERKAWIDETRLLAGEAFDIAAGQPGA